MPRFSANSIFVNQNTGVHYKWMMFHMGQWLHALGCANDGGGWFGSIGLDFSTDGATWSANSTNPVLKDSTWPALGLPAGSSMEKGEVIVTPTDPSYLFYGMAFVINQNPGQANSADYCSHLSDSFAYLLGSNTAYSWTMLGEVSSSGLVYPPETCPGSSGPNPYGPHLLNVSVAYDPATTNVYMTRSYATQSDNPYNGPLPNRIQVYRVSGGGNGALHGTWQLLIDIGCFSTQPYQVQGVNVRPDAAQIVHDGLGNVVFFNGNQIKLEIGTNGQKNDGGDCFPTAGIGTYEVLIGP
jgi:hypothetical protein